MSSHLENSAMATGLEKVSFHTNPKGRQCQRMFKPFIILKDFDLAELRAYEQARDLAVDLLVEWLPKYKFKTWKFHKSSNTPVTLEEKQIRANEIAQNLSDNKEWKSHGRPISREELGKLKLKIDNLEDIPEAYKAISEYNELMRDYIGKYSMKQFIQTRRFL